MVKFGKILFYATLLLIALWQLPWCYSFLASRPQSSPFTLYSCIIGDFVSSGKGENGKIEKKDLSGKIYTDKQFDEILPCFYARQLFTDARFPDSIKGRSVTFKDIQNGSFMFRTTPSDVNNSALQLYPLMESMSGRVDLVTPDDVFRITASGIEFINIPTNAIDAEKSDRFTKTFLSKGFRFPAKSVSGNPTVKKEYDEGYLILDADNRLFHFKQIVGRPYLMAIALPDGVSPQYIYETEFRGRQYMGFFVDADLRLYVIRTGSYEVLPTSIPAFDPLAESLTIIGNPFDWTVRITSDQSDVYYAVDADDYSIIKEYSYPQNEMTFAEKIGEGLYSIALHFTDRNDKFIYPRLGY